MNDYKYVKNSRARLKERIIYVMGDKCACCGYDKCNAALELHHIDPTQKDFTISANTNRSWASLVPEIQKCVLVCANCHREIEAGLRESPSSSFIQERADEISQTIEDLKTHKIYYCKRCGKEISKGATHCEYCAKFLQRKVERPSREELKQLIRTMPFTTIANQYEVTDNTIRKWCDAEGLPRRVSDIKQYSDEEWVNV